MGITRKRKVLGEVNGNHQSEEHEAPPAKQIKTDSREQKQFDAQSVSSSLTESSVPAINPPVTGLGSLPDELLELIFKMLPQKDQLSLAETSRRMAENFESTAILKNFNFTLDFDQELPETKRKYSFVTMKNLTIQYSNECKDAIKTVMETLGDHIKKLKIISGTVSEKFLIYLLSFCRNLESISFENLTITQSAVPQQLSLPALKYLRIDGESSLEHMQQTFQRICSLEELVLEAYESDDDDDSDDDSGDTFRVERARVAVDLMLRQQNLKKVYICDAYMFETALPPIPFKLESVLLSIAFMTSLQLENLKKFVRTQNELQTVTLNVRTGTGTGARQLLKALRYLLALPGLKSLSIVFYEESKMGYFYRDATSIRNPSVEDLYISVDEMKYSYKRFITTTATMFPNLKQLHLKLGEDWMEPDVTSKTFAPLNRLSHLKTLEFENINTSILRKLETNITTFRVGELASFEKAYFESFLRKNQLLEDIAIRFENKAGQMQSAIHLIESAVLLLPRIKFLRLCTNAVELSADQRKRIEDAVAQSSSLKKLSICNKEF